MFVSAAWRVPDSLENFFRVPAAASTFSARRVLGTRNGGLFGKLRRPGDPTRPGRRRDGEMMRPAPSSPIGAVNRTRARTGSGVRAHIIASQRTGRRTLCGRDTGKRAASSVEQRSDEQLLADYREGDEAALEALIRRYRNELLHFLIRFLGSRSAAEDVFQETFLQIHVSAATFDVERRFKPWLFTIAANKARDYHRKHRKKQALSLSASVGDEEERGDFVDLLDSELPTPDAPIVDSERSRLVKDVVDRLPPHLREILLLSYFQRMSYTQIADALEIPLGTVKSRLHSAVAAFARAWKVARTRDQGVS